MDASPRIGLGHVMRCSALAKAWQSHGGGGARFLCRDLPERVAAALQAAGFELVFLAPDGGEAQVPDLSREAAWLVADGHGFQEPDYDIFVKGPAPLLIINDHCERNRYPSRLLLNHTLFAETMDYGPRLPQGRALLGPAYGLLRPEFGRQRQASRQVARQARRLLVTLGGADPRGGSLKFIEALGGLDLAVTVVVGAANPALPALRGVAEKHDGRVRLVVDPPDMAQLMAQADLAVATAGVTVLELACLGVPMVLVSIHDGEARSAQAAAARGMARYLGDLSQVSPADLRDAVAALAEDHDARLAMSRAGQGAVDGAGASRVVRVLCDEARAMGRTG